MYLLFVFICIVYGDFTMKHKNEGFVKQETRKAKTFVVMLQKRKSFIKTDTFSREEEFSLMSSKNKLAYEKTAG